jgi:cystathionine gamma-synthase
MAAVSATLHLAPAGGVVVLPEGAYNTTLALADALAADGRIAVRRVDVTDTAAVACALDGAAMLWLESPTNPLLDVADVEACCRAARRAGALAVVDNTFATPLLQRPLELGADVVVHSVTKYLSGHSDVVLGAVVTPDEALYDRLRTHRTVHGAVAGPWETWLALRGLRTLHLRLERACANASELADRLAGHPAVTRVRYPGWGAMVSVEVAGGAPAADAVARAVRLWVPATSLGGVESTLERRRRHATEPLVVPESLLRLSVGVEHVEDLWADLETALGAAAPGRAPR